MDQFVTTKTVVGEPVQTGDTIIIPLIDVTCGMAAGAFAEGSKQKDKGCGGMSAKMSPSAVLIIQNGVTKLINVKNQDAVTKVIDMAPDLINRFFRRQTASIRRDSSHCKRNSCFLCKESKRKRKTFVIRSFFFKKWYYLIKKNQTAPLQHIINMEGSCFFYEKSLGTDVFFALGLEWQCFSLFRRLYLRFSL